MTIGAVPVSVVDGPTLRFLQVAQPIVLDYPLGRTDLEYATKKSTLAKIATGGNETVYDTLSTAGGGDLKTMSTAVSSSLHVPITIDGQAAVVSFWSKEAAAFPPAAVEVLRPLAKLVAPEKE